MRRASNSTAALLGLLASLASAAAIAGEPPDWMRALVAVPTPEHDEKATAVVMHSEYLISVRSANKLKRVERVAYRILRPGGEHFGLVRAFWDPQSKVTDIHGWSIPPAGKYFEVKDRDSIETDMAGVASGYLVSDVHAKLLQIPSSTVGSLVGYEIEYELHPDVLNDEWDFQDLVPLRESKYSLQLPAGWNYSAVWINHAPLDPVANAPGQWTWTVGAMPRIYDEEFMPPWRGIAARMVVSLQPPAGQARGWSSWAELGNWWSELARGRRDPTGPVQQKAQELTANETSTLGKLRALAHFAQIDIRYVAIELGIGGLQPHAATDVLTHRYGDCKDKATILAAMLKTIGVDSYYLVINTVRGRIAANTPPNVGFDHMILAIALPKDVSDPSLVATLTHPSLGKLLIFDPTDELTPFGALSGPLQANYGLLITPSGGELIATPQFPPDTNLLTRTGTFVLDEQGNLQGDVNDVWTGDRANSQRYRLRSATAETDRIKPIESMMAHSLSKFFLTKASVSHAAPGATAQPFEWHYSFEAAGYAKTAGDLLLVRPRVFDEKGSGFLETKEPRHYAIEFSSPSRDDDTFEIALPAGYEVEELPPVVKAEYSFGSYRSKTEVVGRKLRYTRSMEIRQVSIPVTSADSLKEFYRKIFGDEQQTAILKRIGR